MKDPILVALGGSLRAARVRRGLSQESLAHRADLDRTYVGGIERGERNVAVLNLVRISRALGVHVAELLKTVPR